MMLTRFAPSPTGPLHLGHAYSAMLAADMARSVGGRILLRFEDIDRSRARTEWATAILDDLSWLGVIPDLSDENRQQVEVFRQSDRLSLYANALERLWSRGLLYQCFCRRRDIEAATAAPQEGAPLRGPDGIIYPGTCRPSETPTGPMPAGVLRLDMSRALSELSNPTISYTETGEIDAPSLSPDRMIQEIGDVVLARRDIGTSYHLSVVVDDADQGISHVIRGADLGEATPIHVLLQRLLGFPSPVYHHHRLIRDETGKRLAKRDDARSIATYRARGATPRDIRDLVSLPQVT